MQIPNSLAKLPCRPAGTEHTQTTKKLISSQKRGKQWSG